MMTVAAVAAELNVSPATVRKWCRSGELPAEVLSVSAGSQRPSYRIDPADLAAFRVRRRVQAAKPAPRRPRMGNVVQYV